MRNTSFVDSKGSSKDFCLLGPPSVEFAPYGRVPSGKLRKDARQGTIDQDPEFMSFLESLTNPVTKSAPVDQDEEGAKSKEKVTVTPLVQYIKDKKANKGREQAAAKAAKQARHEKESKAIDAKTAIQNNSPSSKRSAQAVKVEKAARDAVKVLNKQAASAKAPSSTQPVNKAQSVTPPVASNSAVNSALASKQRERGNVKAAAQILQRDLGIGGNSRSRASRHALANTPGKSAAPNNQPTGKPNVGANPAKQAVPPPSASVTSPPNASPAAPARGPETQPPSGPTATRTNPRQENRQGPQQPTPKPQPSPSTSTQAFLKHANPSQGVTEPLLEEAFKVFGTVTNVEIDKRKGFAYIDFAEPQMLQKAIKASPIKIAEGSVQVLERKTGQQLQAKNTNRISGPIASNANNRGGPQMMNNHPRGGPAMGNSSFRGGHISNRGGMPGGGRGGHLRGRGGMARGGTHMNQAKAAGPNSGNAPAATATVQPPVEAMSDTRSTPIEPAAG